MSPWASGYSLVTAREILLVLGIVLVVFVSVLLFLLELRDLLHVAALPCPIRTKPPDTLTWRWPEKPA